MSKFTSKQIRRFYALRKAKDLKNQQWKLKEDDINTSVIELLGDVWLYLSRINDSADLESSDKELIGYALNGLTSLTNKLENNELRITLTSKNSK